MSWFINTRDGTQLLQNMLSMLLSIQLLRLISQTIDCISLIETFAPGYYLKVYVLIKKYINLHAKRCFF